MRGAHRAWASAAVLWTLGAAAPGAAEPPGQVVAPLTVTAPSRPAVAAGRRRVERFVDRIAPHPYGASMSRWRDPICPLVAGMTAAQGEAVLAQITRTAEAAGAPVAAPGKCHPNFYVIVNHDPRALLKAWRARDVQLFVNMPPQAVEALAASRRPALAWRSSEDRSTRGLWLDRVAGEYGNAPQVRFAEDTRLKRNTQRTTVGAVVVLDANRLEGLTIGQIADYAALAGLAEVDLDAAPAEAPTILNLFRTDGGPRPEGLSAWDQAFLKALYKVPQKLVAEPAMVAEAAAREAIR